MFVQVFAGFVDVTEFKSFDGIWQVCIAEKGCKRERKSESKSKSKSKSERESESEAND